MEQGLIARLASVALAALAASPALAQTVPLPRGAQQAPDAVRPLLGAWDLELDGSPRRCTVTFAAEIAAGTDRRLRFPATCRRALSILGEASQWGVTPQGQPQVRDKAGKELIVFAQGYAGSGFSGKGSDGQNYKLSPGNHPRAEAPPPRNVAAQRAEQAAQRTTVDPARAPAAETLPGRYVVMRQQNREACRLDLNAAGSAAFAGACGDTGLAIFDPAAWRYERGRLTLLARRGHVVELVFESGQWRKDPPLGAPLMLRKLP